MDNIQNIMKNGTVQERKREFTILFAEMIDQQERNVCLKKDLQKDTDKI